jgi:hypothetical protein
MRHAALNACPYTFNGRFYIRQSLDFFDQNGLGWFANKQALGADS